MSKIYRRLLLFSFLAVSLSFTAIGEAVQVELKEVRHWTAPDHTRVVFDFNTKGEYRIVEPREPKSICLEFPFTRSGLSSENIEIGDGLVKKVNFIRDKDSLRVNLELEEEATFKIFFLEEYIYSPNLYKPNRIVVDVIKPETKGPEELPEKELKDLRKTATKIVVIDPGHGGEDPGAIGRSLRLKEKDVVLDISKRLVDILNNTPKIQAFLTRSGDYFIPLRKRIEIAKQYGADLFVSIHTNANHSPWEKGSSVYTLSLGGATDEASRLLAEQENAADMIGGVVEVEDDTLKILLDLTQTATLNESLIAAGRCMDNIATLGKTENDGVKQAGFVVLKLVNIPSILIETAFISNRNEEALLATPEFRQGLAWAISKGIAEYFGFFGLEEPAPTFVKLTEEEKLIPKCQPTKPKKREPSLKAGNRRIQRHIVKKGETLWRIAKDYGISAQELRQINGLSNSKVIKVGQRLFIPR